ncbi:MAG: D-alanyl-D-alanine carboxypeptidase/D-alanyl-D-alanine-endopeptidase [bacterium]
MRFSYKCILYFFIPLFIFHIAKGSSKAFDIISYLDSAFSDHVSFSFIVRDAETGTILFEKNAAVSLVPASTLKIVTSVVALKYLGEGKRFTTDLAVEGEVKNGVLNGNIIIIGSGDPSLGMDIPKMGLSRKKILDTWVDSIKKEGIEKIEGNIIGDASSLDSFSLSPYALWEDIGNYYGAVTSGLAFCGNEYKLILRSDNNLGDSVDICGTDPQFTGIKNFENHLIAGSADSGDHAYIFGSPLAERRVLKGTIPLGKNRYEIRGSLPDPAYTCAALLKQALCTEHISVSGEAFGSWRGNKGQGINSHSNKKVRIIYRYLSPSLGELIQYMNNTSNNVFAEQLLKILGREKGKNGSMEGGLEVINTFLKDEKISIEGVSFKDGSGLSRYNSCTTRFITDVLINTYKKEYFNAFKESLQLGIKGTELSEHLFVKTGSMERVFALSGYLKTKENKYLAFSFMVNNTLISPHEIGAIYEKIVLNLLKLSY